MKSYYSILKFVNNPITNENISLGLITITNGQVQFKISKQKMDVAKKLDPSSKNMLKFYLEQIENFISHDFLDKSERLIQFPENFNYNFLERLSKYNNGIIQFSTPSTIEVNFDKELFETYFKKLIGEQSQNIRQKITSSDFQKNIERKFYKPLENKIDIDFTLKKESIPNLFLDFHLDGLGANGAIYSAKSLDFNKKSIGDIRAQLAEYESVIQRLDAFANIKGLNEQSKHYLISDKYNGNSLSYMDLYSMVEDKKLPTIELIDSNGLNKVVNLVKRKNASKFSEKFLN